jgi:hypothetical protein
MTTILQPSITLPPPSDILNCDMIRSLSVQPHRLNGWFTIHIELDKNNVDYLISLERLGLAQISARSALEIARLRMCCMGDEQAIVRGLLANAREPVEIIQTIGDGDIRYLTSFADQSLIAVRLRADKAEMMRDELFWQLEHEPH